MYIKKNNNEKQCKPPVKKIDKTTPDINII